MRTSFLIPLLLIASGLYAQDTIGILKIKKMKVETGSITGTWRMTYKELNKSKGKISYDKQDKNSAFTMELKEDGHYVITQNNGQSWKGKWKIEDTVNIILSPGKGPRDVSRDECLPQHCKIWRVEEISSKKMTVKCTFERRDRTDRDMEVQLVKLM